ncbi:hypothetical protein A5634_09445 [Mycobacterium asiaticum]|uniref:Serine/threonine protein kinase n=2 Tax=Mycobacterium asiaticum TaxID=1790 RepID=A0A1A3NJ19_MYCAS|nr:hypothetical protein A5634_09445 [Mycobacterium asiaticum]
MGVSPAATAAPGKLMGMLPEGFSSSNCETKTPKPPAIEKVACGQSTVSGGPAVASFGLFQNVTDLETGFGNVPDGVTSVACPGNKPSPGPWTYSNGNTGGQVQCATGTADSGKFAMIVWTNRNKLRIGAVRSTDGAGLYRWWQSNAG